MDMEEFQSIERNIADAKDIASVGEALERLKKNKDFKAVILEGYFKAEAIRLVHLRGDPAFQTPERKQSILNQIDAIGILSGFFYQIEHKTRMAEQAIRSGEEELEEMLKENMKND